MSSSSAKRRQRGDFKPKLIALSVAACFSLSNGQSFANPTGGTVGSGSATFASSGNTLTITNSANAIINWQSFSIGVNEITQFLQSSGSSAVLNRVVGANGVIPQSVIDGILSSNGRVFLINPSGVVIGSTGRIDVAGFVASSLNLSDQDFLNGRLRFTETPGAGAVSNAGVIDTSSGGAGGRVFLVGPDVQNSGLIRSPQGQIVLAAGKSVELVSENSPFVTVRVVADTEQALNVGQLISDSGRIGMFGALVRQGGVVEANSAVVGANGEIRLVATKDLTLDAGSLTTANGPSGGTVTLQAQGGTNLISGTVEAKGSSGQGGTIQALGVRVGVIGHGVIDASGDAGGGTVLVGGDAHGANPDVQNAQQTVIGSDGIIRADAGTTGDGGRVIVWSDESTRFFGSISARGGSQSGNGGFVETSGRALQAFGSVDTSAPRGNGGEWLLDPTDINIGLVGIDQLTCLAGVCFDDPPLVGNVSTITAGTLDAGLRLNGSVTLQAHRDINLQTDLNLTYGGGAFIAQAGNNINLGGNITANGTNITLRANDPASLTPSGYGSITSGPGFGNITTNGGSVNLLGYGVAVGNISTYGSLGSGSLTVAAAGDIVTGSLATFSTAAGVAGGAVKLATDSGKITVNGSIDTRGADGSFAIVDGASGGNVLIERRNSATTGTVSVSGGIITNGGNGITATSGQGGSGGSAGDVFISGLTTTVIPGISGAPTVVATLSGDILVAGGISARGGNAANSSGTFAGALGGQGGSVNLRASGNVSVGNANGAIDVSGGLGGAGPGTSGPGNGGGAGGSAGFVDLQGGQSLTVVGAILADGGAGGNGGAASSGGSGGGGGVVTLRGAGSIGSISAIGGNGGTAPAGSAIGLGGSGGEVLISAPGDIALGGAINAFGGLDGARTTRTCCGLIEIVAGGAVTQTAALTTDILFAAGTDVKLDVSNTVKSLLGSATSGSFTFVNSGDLDLMGVSASGVAAISATGNITGTSFAGLPPTEILPTPAPFIHAVHGDTGVTLSAGGAIGSTAAPLAVSAPALDASAAYGIAIDLNALGPTPATVNTLRNSTTGDIVLNAHGGTTITSLVSSPGNVTIHSFSPLDIQRGITAGGDIFLSTAGPSLNATLPNDMTLSGTFTYRSGGAFDVTIGSFGTLHLPGGLDLTATPPSPYPLNITQLTFSGRDPLANSIVVAAYNTTVAKQALGSGIVEEPPKRDRRDDKKAAAVCK